VEIHVDADNVRSVAVPTRLGFRQVATRGLLVNMGAPQLVERPIRIYRLTDATYPGSSAASARLEAFDRDGARLL
jgi:RimJ/RimL family protein N-acetyltransferase